MTGRLRVVSADDVLDSAAFPGRQGRLVFAFLAANRRPVPREELADALWPAGPPANWKRDISVLVSKLRVLLQSIGLQQPDTLLYSGGCYDLRLPAGSAVDVHVLLRQAADAVRALDEGDADAALACAVSVIDPGRQAVLPGEDAPWIAALRDELGRARLATLDVAARVLGERGDLPSAIACATEAVELAPFRESGYVSLMRLHLVKGDRAEALRTYERCRQLLADELGVDPAPETESAFLQALRAHRNATTIDPSGERVPGNLPAPLTSLVGRHSEIEHVAAALAEARLVTLTGVGGVGKSRLALECAARMAPGYPGGVWECELARLSAGESVVHALAGALGVSERPERTIEGSVVDFLRSKQVLLVMDNCEHVLDAVAGLVQALLQACPRLAVLATSREWLGLAGERVLPLQPLPVPAAGADPGLANASSAVRLFCDRAAAAHAGFALSDASAAAVADVCRRLDGLPLAIELAAARVRTMNVEELAARLDERFHLLSDGPRTGDPRHRTLRGMVDWSYKLLTPSERQIFDEVSVFAGSFSAEAAAAVCGQEAHGTEAAIAALSDRSMIVADTTQRPTRYRLLETVRMYGRERLAEQGGSEGTCHRHAAYFVRLAQTAARQLRGPDESLGAATLEREWDDLRAAHRWCLGSGESDLALTLSGGLYWYVLFRVRAEAPRWAEDAIEIHGADAHPLFPVACATAGVGCWMRGELGRAADYGQQGLRAARGHASRRYPLDVLGAVALFEGRLDASADYFTEGANAAREAGDRYHLTHLLGDTALVRAYQGMTTEARRAAHEARQVARTTANPSATAWSLYVDGEIRGSDDAERAIGLLEATIELARSVGSTFVLGVALVAVSSIRGRHGDPAGALQLFLQVVEHWHRVGNWTQQWTTLRNVIDLLVRIGADTPAAVLLGAVRAAESAAPPFGTDARRLAAAARVLLTRLGRLRFSAATTRGEAMTGDEVIAFVGAELRQAASKTGA